MSAQPPPNKDPFVPPPPPTPGNPMYPPNVLAAKTAAVASDARTALILSIVGLFCFGFIFGFLAYRRANEALETIAIYQVAEEKRGIAMTAKVLSIIDIVGWIIALLARIALR
ncbi:MAG TPA: hypothetical protein VK208_07870 [Pyrinomonadaceae bacterium]|nr:hypothetical protein [Pyrinomonadaceae bacterium]